VNDISAIITRRTNLQTKPLVGIKVALGWSNEGTLRLPQENKNIQSVNFT